MAHIQETTVDNLDPLQFAYRQKWSNGDAVSTAIHTALTHLEGLLATALHPTQLSHTNSGKPLTPGLTPTLCNWVLNFLTDRAQ